LIASLFLLVFTFSLFEASCWTAVELAIEVADLACDAAQKFKDLADRTARRARPLARSASWAKYGFAAPDRSVQRITTPRKSSGKVVINYFSHQYSSYITSLFE
jgi:hypothetical protein